MVNLSCIDGISAVKWDQITYEGSADRDEKRSNTLVLGGWEEEEGLAVDPEEAEPVNSEAGG